MELHLFLNKSPGANKKGNLCPKCLVLTILLYTISFLLRASHLEALLPSSISPRQECVGVFYHGCMWENEPHHPSSQRIQYIHCTSHIPPPPLSPSLSLSLSQSHTNHAGPSIALAGHGPRRHPGPSGGRRCNCPGNGDCYRHVHGVVNVGFACVRVRAIYVCLILKCECGIFVLQASSRSSTHVPPPGCIRRGPGSM